MFLYNMQKTSPFFFSGNLGMNQRPLFEKNSNKWHRNMKQVMIDFKFIFPLHSNIFIYILYLQSKLFVAAD